MQEISSELILKLNWNLIGIPNELKLNGFRVTYEHGESPVVENLESNGMWLSTRSKLKLNFLIDFQIISKKRKSMFQ